MTLGYGAFAYNKYMTNELTISSCRSKRIKMSYTVGIARLAVSI